ncbi:MAG: response regulator [Candidatus Nomurabacteria bacterium]|nr:MAG: response regulator [Candidatus Nomurabacteria bacterium]
MPVKKILVVEDDSALLRALGDKLEHEKFTVLRASDGIQGLSVAMQEHPDLILLDIVMPKMDGITMLSQLRDDEWGSDVPVMMLTNLNDADKVQKALENKVFDFLVKADWKLEDLVEKVKTKLGV